MACLLLTGERIPAQVKNPDLSAYASRDPKTGDVTLLLLNRGDRYLRPNGFLDGRDAELSVEAGLDQGIGYEVPSFSINCLKIKADRSPGQVFLYTRKMVREGKPPVSGVLKPW
jgi:hypothetical protein